MIFAFTLDYFRTILLGNPLKIPVGSTVVSYIINRLLNKPIFNVFVFFLFFVTVGSLVLLVIKRTHRSSDYFMYISAAITVYSALNYKNVSKTISTDAMIHNHKESLLLQNKISHAKNFIYNMITLNFIPLHFMRSNLSIEDYLKKKYYLITDNQKNIKSNNTEELQINNINDVVTNPIKENLKNNQIATNILASKHQEYSKINVLIDKLKNDINDEKLINNKVKNLNIDKLKNDINDEKLINNKDGINPTLNNVNNVNNDKQNIKDLNDLNNTKNPTLNNVNNVNNDKQNIKDLNNLNNTKNPTLNNVNNDKQNIKDLNDLNNLRNKKKSISKQNKNNKKSTISNVNKTNENNNIKSSNNINKKIEKYKIFNEEKLNIIDSNNLKNKSNLNEQIEYSGMERCITDILNLLRDKRNCLNDHENKCIRVDYEDNEGILFEMLGNCKKLEGVNSEEYLSWAIGTLNANFQLNDLMFKMFLEIKQIKTLLMEDLDQFRKLFKEFYNEGMIIEKELSSLDSNPRYFTYVVDEMLESVKKALSVVYILDNLNQRKMDNGIIRKVFVSSHKERIWQDEYLRQIQSIICLRIIKGIMVIEVILGIIFGVFVLVGLGGLFFIKIAVSLFLVVNSLIGIYILVLAHIVDRKCILGDIDNCQSNYGTEFVNFATNVNFKIDEITKIDRFEEALNQIDERTKNILRIIKPVIIEDYSGTFRYKSLVLQSIFSKILFAESKPIFSNYSKNSIIDRTKFLDLQPDKTSDLQTDKTVDLQTDKTSELYRDISVKSNLFGNSVSQLNSNIIRIANNNKKIKNNSLEIKSEENTSLHPNSKFFSKIKDMNQLIERMKDNLKMINREALLDYYTKEVIFSSFLDREKTRILSILKFQMINRHRGINDTSACIQKKRRVCIFKEVLDKIAAMFIIGSLIFSVLMVV